MPQEDDSSPSGPQPHQLPLFGTPLDALIERLLEAMPIDSVPFAHTSLGCSRATPTKHRILLGLMEWLLNMSVSAVCGGAPFIYIGTNEGQGFYRRRENGEPMVGSPLIALDVMDRHPLFTSGERRYTAILCEERKASVADLKRAIERASLGLRGDVRIVPGTFEDTLPPLVAELPLRARGFLFTDPNGLLSPGALGSLSRMPQLRNVDLACWVNANSSYRFRQLSEEHRRTTWGNVPPENYQPVSDILASIAKSRWIIREPFSGGYGTNWTFTVGSAWESFPEWRAERFFYLDSIEGQRIQMLCDRKAAA